MSRCGERLGQARTKAQRLHAFGDGLQFASTTLATRRPAQLAGMKLQSRYA